MFQTCPFCHRQVSQFEWSAHLQQHQQLRPDGQMHDHVTVAPDQRYQGSLQGQPRCYVHPRCGGATSMPEEIVRSYLADPFLYNDQSFCTGCQRYVSTDELFWHGTSQSLTEYTKQLRVDYIKRNQLNPADFDWGPKGPTRRKSRVGKWIAAVAGTGVLAIALCGGCVGLVVALSAAHRPRPRQRIAPPVAVAPRLPDFPPPQIPNLPEHRFPTFPEHQFPTLPEQRFPNLPEHQFPTLPENPIRQPKLPDRPSTPSSLPPVESPFSEVERLRRQPFSPPTSRPLPADFERHQQEMHERLRRHHEQIERILQESRPRFSR